MYTICDKVDISTVALSTNWLICTEKQRSKQTIEAFMSEKERLYSINQTHYQAGYTTSYQSKQEHALSAKPIGQRAAKKTTNHTREWKYGENYPNLSHPHAKLTRDIQSKEWEK